MKNDVLITIEIKNDGGITVNVSKSDGESELDQLNREKNRARGRVALAVQKGDLPRISERICVDCGEQAVEYHHPDYTRPLVVVPLCRSCHNIRHRKSNAELSPGSEPTPEIADAMRKLYDDGVPKTAICKRFWGYKDGVVWDHLTSALEHRL